MRKKSTEVALLAISLLMLAGCNEKISAELQSGSTVTPPTVAPTTFSFKVTETSNANLGYSLHQTGLGNKSKKCEVTRESTAFNDDDFIGNPAAYDITCFMEAEELALYSSGMKLKIETSPDACEFVGYEPFSFYTHMAGDSTANFRVVTCGNGITNADANAFGAPYGATTGACNEYVDTTVNTAPLVGQVVPVASKRPLAVLDEDELCRYNHPANKCDTGVITIQEINLTLVSGVVTPNTTTRQIACGGAVANCVAGPIRLESKFDGSTRGTLVTEIVDGASYSDEKVYAGLINKSRGSNIEYVNYRRFLASTVLNFWDDISETVIPGGFLSNSPADYNFEPDVYSAFRSNRRLDNSGYMVVDPTTVRTTASAVVGYATKPFSVEPYMGLADRVSTPTSRRFDYAVNPFYTFLCLDNAMETTARIRIMVRDWDRSFDKNASYMELLSDVDYGTTSRQDRQDFVTDIGSYNDLQDWDDLIPLARRTGSYNPAITWWAPVNPIFVRDGDNLDQANFPQGL